ncbi:porin family protein [Chitinophaga sp. 22321]|uniref:PorT family protein n=1 Tax=Chitinophaga hostae TaxID=2831022 RepID=A0ABS5J640_9BACT|nr:porin family protein [Chitinophaga hostae]MBS0030671.1 PorT family protein [Chitinophaga hostae]
MKYIWVMIFFLSLFQPTQAQKDSSGYREVSFGMKAGFLSGSLYGKDLHLLSAGGYVKPLPGIFAGITIQSRLGKYFGLQSELSIGQSAVMLHLLDSNSNQLYNSRFKSTYLVIAPITPTLYFHGFRLSAGPYVSGLLHSSVEYKNQDGQISADKSIFGTATSPGKFRYKIDAGIALQLRYEFKNGWNLGAAYTRGFIPVIEDPRVQHQWKIYNQQFNLFLGYQWRKR